MLEQLGGPARAPPDGTAAGLGGRPARRRRRPQRHRGALPARRAACCVAARRRVRPRRADHQAADPGGHAGGAGAAARGAAVGRRRGFGQHRHRVVPQRPRLHARWRSNATSSAANGSSATPRPSASGVDVRGPSARGVRRALPDPAAIFVGGGLTQPGLLEACLERLPVGGRLVANAVTVESEAVLCTVVFTARRASCGASSTTAASRSAASPAGVPRCRSPSGRWSSDDRVLHRGGPRRRRPDHGARAAAARAAVRSACTRARSCPTICWHCARRMRASSTPGR